MSAWPLVWVSRLVGFLQLFLTSPVVPFCTSLVYSLEPRSFFAQYNAFYRSKKKKKDAI